MCKTCNLSTVKNTPSEARRGTHTLYYLIVYKVSYDDIDDYHYNSVLQIVCSIMEVLEYNDLSCLDGAVIRAIKSDGSHKDLYMISNDISSKNITLKRI